jgi:hypothetical protein
MSPFSSTRSCWLSKSRTYPDSMVKGRMVFMRFNEDHHGLGLVGQGGEISRQRQLHHIAFEVPTIDEVLRARDHLAKTACRSIFMVGDARALRCRLSFATPTAILLKSSGGSTKWIGMAKRAHPNSGSRNIRSKKPWTMRRLVRTPRSPIQAFDGNRRDGGAEPEHRFSPVVAGILSDGQKFKVPSCHRVPRAARHTSITQAAATAHRHSPCWLMRCATGVNAKTPRIKYVAL